MIYLTTKSNPAVRAAIRRGDLGWMATPQQGFSLREAVTYPAWAADNGCYTRSDRFQLADYLDWLKRMRPAQAACLFATAPDVVADAAATLERSVPVLPVLRGLGYRAALVAQDGLEGLILPWDAFDALFVGGSTGWKLSVAAYRLAAEASRRGKWVHMGRVNSRRRWLAAVGGGYDSADGTLLRFGPDTHLPTVLGWVRETRAGAICPPQPAVPAHAARQHPTAQGRRT